MNKKINKLIEYIDKADLDEANKIFREAIREKANLALDIKRVALTSKIYDKVKDQ